MDINDIIEPEGNLLIRLMSIGMQHPFLHQIELRAFMVCPEQMRVAKRLK